MRLSYFRYIYNHSSFRYGPAKDAFDAEYK